MRVAFVISSLSYPPREGLHQQSLVTATLLKNPDRTVHLYGFVKNRSLLDEAALTRDLGLRFELAPISTRLPDLVLFFANRLLPLRLRPSQVRSLVERLTEYDVVHLENVGAAGLSRPSFARRTIVGLIDPGTLRWRRFASSASSIKDRVVAQIKCFLHSCIEQLIAFPGITFQVVSKKDREYLQRRHPFLDVIAIPVSVPSNLFDYPLSTRDGTDRPILVAYLDLRQHHLRKSFLWFAREVLSRSVYARSAQLMVLGRVPADAELISAVGDIETSFLEWVEDYREILGVAAVVVTPDLLGTGLKNRVIQSMAMGRAVLGTSVAFEGIDIKSGLDAVEADDPVIMASHLDALLNDSMTCNSIGAAARASAFRQFDRSTVRKLWIDLYDRIKLRASP